MSVLLYSRSSISTIMNILDVQPHFIHILNTRQDIPFLLWTFISGHVKQLGAGGGIAPWETPTPSPSHPLFPNSPHPSFVWLQ